MELRPEFQIKTALKALADVVLPAVDANNQLAQEQGKLILAVLQMALRNLPLMYAYDRAELSDLVVLAANLCSATQDQDTVRSARERLCVDLENARRYGAEAGSPADLGESVFALRASIGALVSDGFRQLDDEPAKSLSDAVIAHAKKQLLRERALLIAQGWEAAPDTLPPIQDLIGIF